MCGLKTISFLLLAPAAFATLAALLLSSYCFSSSSTLTWLSFIMDESVGSRKEDCLFCTDFLSLLCLCSSAFLALSISLCLSSSWIYSLFNLSYSSCCFFSCRIYLPFCKTVSAMNCFNLEIFIRCLICSLLRFYISSNSLAVNYL